MSRWRGNGGIIGGINKRNYLESSNEADGVWGLEQTYNQNNAPPYGTAEFLANASSYTWTVPVGVTSISMLCVAGGGGAGGTGSNRGGGGGGGGALAYKNNVSVTPGETLEIFTGLGGLGSSSFASAGNNGTFSRVKKTSDILPLCLAEPGFGGGAGVTSGSATQTNGGQLNGAFADGGGSGGHGGRRTYNNAGGAGGGGGGYSGSGGRGAYGNGNAEGEAGSGGGGAGGQTSSSSCQGGGGVGKYGQGANGSLGTNNGGSGGLSGLFSTYNSDGGPYGGGGGADDDDQTLSGGNRSGDGGAGIVVIVWGLDREYPSTNVDLASWNAGPTTTYS